MWLHAALEHFSFIFCFVQVWVVSGELSGSCGARRACSPRRWATLEGTRPTPPTKRSALVCRHTSHLWLCSAVKVSVPVHTRCSRGAFQNRAGSVKQRRSGKKCSCSFICSSHVATASNPAGGIVDTGSQWCENTVKHSKSNWFFIIMYKVLHLFFSIFFYNLNLCWTNCR